uniref:Uncharacterized protein n=1 Tax=viral metagenome TaxID=1070528 RepID=A0A6H1ZXL2_9ZZZZ
MPRLKKVLGAVKKKTVVKKLVVEEPVVEEKDLYVGKELGTAKIVKSCKKEINGVEYIEVTLSDNTTSILSERDLDKQAK